MKNVRRLTKTQVTFSDTLKNFEAVDFFRGEHPGSIYIGLFLRSFGVHYVSSLPIVT